MAEKLPMLALSPTMERGTIVKWHKKEGDKIEEGEVLCEVETDKATMEYESINQGTLLKRIIPEGTEVRVGETIAIIGEKDEDIKSMLEELKNLPRTSEELQKSEVEQKLEEKPKAKEAIIKKLPQQQTKEFPTSETQKPFEQKNKSIAEGKGIRVKASPLARKLAKRAGIDLSTVKGSGPEGRIIKADINRVLRDFHETGEVPAQRAVRGVEEKHYARGLKIKNQIPVSGKRKIIAQRLSESMFTAPHYYLKISVNMDSLLSARSALNSSRKEKVSFNSFLIKLSAEALKKHPMLNAGWKGDKILQYASADIGLAVALPDGLITPIIRDCWNKGIIEIDNEIKELVQKAQQGKLSPEEYTDATFTITNLGSYGVREFTAIINPPGSAILAVGEIIKEPIVNEDNSIAIQQRMILTLSCDHRVVDGAVGALFLRELKEYIENPFSVLY